MGIAEIVFFVVAVLAVVSALGVILHPHPVYSALFLVVALFQIAVLFILLDAQMVAFLQVIVYAGAIMVLFLFVIMLLNLQHMHEPATRPIQQFLGYTFSAAFLIGIVYYLIKYAVFAVLPTGPFQASSQQIGVALFEEYVFPFEMVSILLLAAIVGALLLSGRAKAPAEVSS